MKLPNQHKLNVYRRRQLKKAVTFIAFCLFVIVFIPSVIVFFPKDDRQLEVLEVAEAVEESSPIEVKVKRSETGVVEEVALESYVASVVASEMPAEFELEALKAQAIAARTYIVNHLLQKGEDEVITDTTEHQVFKSEAELKEHFAGDYEWKMQKVHEAVQATKDEIITYEKTPITPTFFSMSNGYTEDAENYWGNELPYLKSVESKWEEKLPNFIDQKIFTKEEVAEKLQVKEVQELAEAQMEIKRTNSNRVKELQIGGQTISGKEVREKLQLRSNDFTVKQKGDHYIFTTKGYGHGVGMSQYGANEMAKQGKSYQEILTHYYQDIAIEALAETVPTLVAK